MQLFTLIVSTPNDALLSRNDDRPMGTSSSPYAQRFVERLFHMLDVNWMSRIRQWKSNGSSGEPIKGSS